MHQQYYASISPGRLDDIFSDSILQDLQNSPKINLWDNFIVNKSLHINMLLLSLCAAHSIALCNVLFVILLNNLFSLKLNIL